MARTIKGAVIQRTGKRGASFAVRFQVDGKRHFVTLGNSSEGWTKAKAEIELQNVLADVRRGHMEAAHSRSPAARTSGPDILGVRQRMV